MSHQSQYLSDYRSDKDLLDFDLFSPALLEIIQKASTPLTLGIYGSWGTGKTSLLHQLKSKIESGPYQRVVWFTAWKYEQQDALWRAFLLRIIDGLYPHKKENERYSLDELMDENQRAGAEYLDRLERSIYEDVSWTESGEWRFNTVELVKQGIRLPIWLAFQLVGHGVAAKDLGITPELAKILEREAREHHLNQLKSLEQFATEFEKAIKLFLGDSGRLIVFVDDLDRCLPEKAVQILEAIKLFMDVPGVVIVLGMDREIIQRGIETFYGAMLNGEKGIDAIPIDGDNYLQKMVQIPFYLPPLPDNGRGNFINKLLGSETRLDTLTRQVFSMGVFPTPRQIKRVLNIFFLLRQIADAQESRDVSKGDILNPLLAKTVLIQSQWPELYQDWRQHPGLIQALEDYYVQNPLSEDEHLFGRESAEIPGDADLPSENEERSTVRPARNVLATGLMSPYVNNRQKYALLGSLLCFPPDRSKSDWAQCHFTGLTLKQLNNYIGLVGALESAPQVKEAELPEGLLTEIQSGDAVLLKTLIARLRDAETDPSGQQHKRLRQQLLQAMQDGTNPAPNRAAVGAALAEIGDPRFRLDAFYLPDEPLLGFIHIPAGRFTMGSDPKIDKDAQDIEQPQHEVDLGEYYIARYPVTVAQFKAFVEANKYQPRDPDCLHGFANHPVVKVTWYDALAYCDWLTKQLPLLPNLPAELCHGWQVALPTEAEWERAARGIGYRIYPWGNEFDPNKANTKETGIRKTSVVGCFPAGSSPEGLLDASGNVWEWTRSLEGSYPSSNVGSECSITEILMTANQNSMILRGGSWSRDQWDARCTFRFKGNPDHWYSNRGFRVSLCKIP